MLLFEALLISLIPVVFSGGGSMASFIPIADVFVPDVTYAACQGKVMSPLTFLSTNSAIECGVQCHVTVTCLAFSYNPSLANGCILSDYYLTVPEAGWITMVQKSLEDLCRA
ncbi:uncharacterized protein LOC124280979 [Haliotis rubra]|uniref:uncharacterized protein LOC124280979 n=1 Tax=Haliotis rubra TaxID=36100 RepID=UPI001EE621A8|nr:uncharacterized protein LOC124280979 [Haliotis rubra]